MFCKKCGKIISDGVKFCTFCGAPAGTDEMPIMPVAPVEDATEVLTEEEGALKEDPVTSQPMAQPEPVYGAGAGTPQAPAASPEPKKKSNVIVLAILGVIAAALAAAVLFLVSGLLGGGKKASSKVFYMKDAELSAVLDMTAKDPEDVRIEKIKNGGSYPSYGLVRLSEDGSYLYYYSKVDSDGQYGTLCRIPVGKLKKDESANDKLVEEIDSKVNIDNGFRIINNTSVLYVRKDDELSLYEKGESVELADSVSDYWVTDDDKYVIYLDGDDDSTLYTIEISKNSEEKELDSGVHSVIAVGEGDFILYSKDYDEEVGVFDLYLGGIAGKPELVEEEVFSCPGVDSEHKSFYYCIRETQENPLYSYVDDPTAADEAGMGEPKQSDFLASVGASEAISESDLSYYSSMEDFLTRRVLRSYNFDNTFGMYGYYNSDDGRSYYYNDGDGSWYVYNEERYQTAYQEYRAASKRIELRISLQGETIEQPFYRLHYYKGGSSKEICANVGRVADSAPGGVVYTRIEAGEATVVYPIDDIYSVEDLRSRVASALYGGMASDTDEFYCTIAGGAESAVTDFDTVSSLYLSEDQKTAVIEGDYDEGEYRIMAYAVGSGGLGKSASLSKGGSVAGVHENMFYYFEDMDDMEGKLYSYNGSRTALIAKKVIQRGIFIADDGSTIGYSDWDDYDYEGELSVFDKDGKDKTVRKGVSNFRYLGSGAYLFMKNGDLYYQNRKGEETRLAKDVTYYWYPGELPGYYIW